MYNSHAFVSNSRIIDGRNETQRTRLPAVSLVKEQVRLIDISEIGAKCKQTTRISLFFSKIAVRLSVNAMIEEHAPVMHPALPKLTNGLHCVEIQVLDGPEATNRSTSEGRRGTLNGKCLINSAWEGLVV
jgi:hypothetical protein